MTECDDDDAHRSRIAGRQWAIRDWYELDWEHVQRARNEWEPIVDADLVLSAYRTANAAICNYQRGLAPEPRLHNYQDLTFE